MEEFVQSQRNDQFEDDIFENELEENDDDLPDRADCYKINDDEMRFKSPEIAKFRSVVERTIGAMKKFRLLLNIAFISRLKHRHLMKLIIVIAALINFELDHRKTPY
jgi:hypothetical protein